MQPGKVYLVGAGPGSPDLLTVKAAELLKKADVVIFDRLIQQETLDFCRPDAQRIYMGQAVGKHETRQDEVHALLLQKAGEGKTVVRLKGGDPFVFGRGGEEAEFLAEHGIDFEVVPGVSSALAAPLAAAIPVTHRELASNMVIVTGHGCKNRPDCVPWDALARLDTLVFLMGVHNLANICGQLIDHGRAADTPATIIQAAFWPGQRIITGTLADIAEVAREAGVEAPATLIIGKVVNIGRKLRELAAKGGTRAQSRERTDGER